MNNANQKSEPHAAGAPTAKLQLPIHFIKGSNFRVIHASGVWYGGDSQQNLHLTFFNERNPIPKTLVVNLNEQGAVLGEDISKRESKMGVIREMEVDVILSLPAAMELHKTLGENLKAIQDIMSKTHGETLKAFQEIIKHESTVSK